MSYTGNVKLNLPLEINQPLNDAAISQCGAVGTTAGGADMLA